MQLISLKVGEGLILLLKKHNHKKILGSYKLINMYCYFIFIHDCNYLHQLI